jgi:hypothetical protein
MPPQKLKPIEHGEAALQPENASLPSEKKPPFFVSRRLYFSPNLSQNTVNQQKNTKLPAGQFLA